MSSADKSPAAAQGVTPAPPAVEPGPAGETPAQQSLFPQPASRSVAPAPVSRPVTERRQLWLCIHLPMLPLEAASRGESAACAVVEEQHGMRRILQANARASGAGIGPGLSVNAALSLLPDLVVVAREPSCEQRSLERLAAWAERYTSFVSLEPPESLLLELAGSLRLFAGMTALRERIADGLRELGFSARLAAAPTPLAATWLARAGCEISIGNAASLNGALRSLPLACLGWPDGVIGSLRGMGVTTLGECLRLPRSGFAKRFGASRLDELDRAFGRQPDPRDHYRAPARFCATRDLDEEQSDSELLLHVCHELLRGLERFLLTRQLEVSRVRFRFFHLDAPATSLTLGRSRSSRSASHWLDLLRIRFDRLALPAPAIAIELRSAPGRVLSGEPGGSLFGHPGGREDASIVPLVERLSARIGDAAVHGVTMIADHRPQYAWQPTGIPDETPRCAAAAGYWDERGMPELLAGLRRTESLLLRRPLWMLKEPERLATRHGRPLYGREIELVEGPERLESGWWDGQGIARDYFVGRTGEGVLLWIYEDRSERGAWYLHGVFG